MSLDGFDWDAGNSAKCAKHGLSRDEIESVFHASDVRVRPDPLHSTAETRFQAIGTASSGRYVFVVYTLRSRFGLTTIRPISARYMHRREIDRYVKEDPDLPN